MPAQVWVAAPSVDAKGANLRNFAWSAHLPGVALSPNYYGWSTNPARSRNAIPKVLPAPCGPSGIRAAQIVAGCPTCLPRGPQPGLIAEGVRLTARPGEVRRPIMRRAQWTMLFS